MRLAAVKGGDGVDRWDDLTRGYIFISRFSGFRITGTISVASWFENFFDEIFHKKNESSSS